MQTTTKRLSSCLVSRASANFTTTGQIGPYYERPLLDRVVSTSSWPVPYYHRLFKAYPIREDKDKISLLGGDNNIDDCNWYAAKEALKASFRGREVVEYVEKNLDINSYVIIQKDALGMAKGYVADIAQFVDCANKENVRILSSTSSLLD